MPVETRKPLRGGLNLGADPSQAAGMILADGARYDIDGIVTSRLGKTRFDLVYPDEGIDGSEAHAETLSNFAAPKGTLGLAAYYDQRLVTQTQEVFKNHEFTDDTVTPGTPDYWTTTGPFTVPEPGVFRYTTGATNGELRQTSANFDVPMKTNTEYEFRYSITCDNPGLVSRIYITNTLTGAEYPASPGTLTKNTGDYLVYISTSAVTPGNFALRIEDSGAGTTVDIYYVSLREMSQVAKPLQERLYLAYKSDNGFWFNDQRYTDLYGTKRATLTTYGRDIYVVDPDSRPKVFRPLPNREQRYLQKVDYEIRNCGIDWPRRNEDIPRTYQNGTGTPLEVGIYRFRVALENKMGDVSNPSLSSVEAITATSSPVKVVLPLLTTDLTSGPDACKYWRIYVSYEPGVELATGVVKPIGDGPTAFRLWKRTPIFDAAGNRIVSVNYDAAEHTKHNQEALIELERGIWPRLRDFQIIGDVAYGIAEYDVIRRETLILEGDGRPLHFTARLRVPTANQPGFERPAYDSGQITEMQVGPEFLFFSPPGEPQYGENWIRIGKGGEVCVAISEIGEKPVIFTNLGILTLDTQTFRVNRVVSEVGAMTRDGIERTERGIRFIGSDGVPRLFNGATADIVSNEVAPIFRKEDYVGDYLRFDQAYAGSVVTAFGERKFWMSYPTSVQPGKTADGSATSSTATRNLLLCDEAHQLERWSIDKREFIDLLWLGRENRLLGVEKDGRFYALEEGFVDELDPNLTTNTAAPPFGFKFRWFRGAAHGLTQFRRMKMEVDTKGQDVTVTLCVDKKTQLLHTFTINTSGRRLYETGLPAWFKGLYLEAEFTGSTHSTMGRPELFDLQVETVVLGVF